MEVAQGIEYIHAEGAVHGDLRGVLYRKCIIFRCKANTPLQDNILLDANFQVQIADFGLTRLSEATATRSGAVHVNFAAPELFDSPEDDDNAVARTQKSDVYAFGCLHYEASNNKHADALTE
jgi:serine/threonine protein kinase